MNEAFNAVILKLGTGLASGEEEEVAWQ